MSLVTKCCKAEKKEAGEFAKLSSSDQFSVILGQKKIKRPMYVCAKCGKDVSTEESLQTCEECGKTGRLVLGRGIMPSFEKSGCTCGFICFGT